MAFGWLWVVSTRAATPESPDWVPLVSDDPAADASDGTVELLGDAASPVLAWWADEAAVGFRVRTAADLSQTDATIAVLVDADLDWDTFELALLAVAPSGDVTVLQNAAAEEGVWVEGAAALAGVDGRASFQDGAVELWVDRLVWHETLALAPEEPLRFAVLSAVDWADGPLDVGGCDGAVLPCERLSLVSSDAFIVDEDDDGLSDLQEADLGTNPDDDDSDDDGVSDLIEADDLDGDGKSDALTCDSDGDGLSDGVERGVLAPLGDTNLNKPCFRADADPTTRTDPGRADTDGGGLGDGVEDPNQDGARDPFETNPNLPDDDADADGDLVPDVLDDLFGPGPDADSDGDGLLDADEPIGDPDGDGLPSFADPDADGDGIDDAVEGTDDLDEDDLGNWLDADADGDGAPDAEEGWPDATDPDLDDDGVLDGDELLFDTDGDGAVDRLDLDSDGDGIEDGEEGTTDTDEDGVPDLRDLDSDGDGWPDAVEGAVDSDRDGVDDFRDLDSNGDGQPDANELDFDEDCDGVPDRADPDPEDGFCTTARPPEVGDGLPPRPSAPEAGGCQQAPGGPGAWALLLGWVVRTRRPGSR